MSPCSVSLRYSNRGGFNAQLSSKGGIVKLRGGKDGHHQIHSPSESGLCEAVVSTSQEMEEAERHLSKMNQEVQNRLQRRGH